MHARTTQLNSIKHAIFEAYLLSFQLGWGCSHPVYPDLMPVTVSISLSQTYALKESCRDCEKSSPVQSRPVLLALYNPYKAAINEHFYMMLYFSLYQALNHDVLFSAHHMGSA